MRLDLHLHSTASDGSVSPTEVVRRAGEGRLDVVALADHDTTAGVPEARRAAASIPIEVIPALEMSSTWDGRDLHILGYFVDIDAPVLRSHGRRAETLRLERMQRMIARLADQGVDVEIQTVLEIAGPSRGAIGRPHLAKALVRGGYVQSTQEAFDRYISDDHRAFVPTSLQDPETAIASIAEAGGISVWAHPPREIVQRLIGPFVDAGLQGLEVYRPSHSAGYQLELEQLCSRYGLLKTGGSDWHRPEDGTLGEFFIEASEVREFLDAGGL
jgi:predicted metal-dependent phosphoesterase TrpH